MTRKQALLAAVGEVLEQAKTLESWMDDTAYPRQSRASWSEAVTLLEREYRHQVPHTLYSVESRK